jgi:hypothetical protein
MKNVALLGLWLAWAAAHAQSIDIRTPRLPARGPETSTAPSPAATPSPGTGTAHGGTRYPEPSTGGSWGAPGYGSGSHDAAAGGSGADGVASPMRQRRGSSAQPAYAAAAPAPMIATPSSATGHCRVQPSPDRQTLSLMGADGLPRRHVPLGEFRVQRVVHSADGAWAVAITKLRGENQFAAMTLDLAKCESAHTVDLQAAGEDVRFDAEFAIVKLNNKGEQRVPLRSGLVR